MFERLHDKTVIIVSHQQRILDTADKIVLLENDSPVSAGRKEEMFAQAHQAPQPLLAQRQRRTAQWIPRQSR